MQLTFEHFLCSSRAYFDDRWSQSRSIPETWGIVLQRCLFFHWFPSPPLPHLPVFHNPRYLLPCRPLPPGSTLTSPSSLGLSWFLSDSYKNTLIEFRIHSKSVCSYLVVVQSLSHVRLFATPWTACSMPGFPVLHQLLEFAQTHVH